MSPIPHAEDTVEERPDAPRKGCLAPVVLILLIWLAGVALMLHGRNQAGTVIVALEGPWPELVQPGEPARLAGYDARVPAGARLRSVTGSRVTLRTPEGPRLTLEDKTDLTHMGPAEFSLNQGRLEWEGEPGGGEAGPSGRFTLHAPHGGRLVLEPGMASPDFRLHGTSEHLDLEIRGDGRVRHDFEGGDGVIQGAGRYRMRDGRIRNAPVAVVEFSGNASEGTARLTGRLRYPDGASIRDAEAAFYPTREGEGEFQPVGPAGLFEAYGVAAGTYTLALRSNSAISALVGPIGIEDGANLTLDLTLKRGTSLLGMIIDASSTETLMDVSVQAHRVSEEEAEASATSARPQGHITTRTQHQGMFHLEGLDPDVRYDLEFAARGYVAQTLSGFDPNEPRLLVQLEPASAVQGHVLVGPEAPLAFVQVRARNVAGDEFHAITDALGFYRVGQLPAGDYEMSVSRDGEAYQQVSSIEVPSATELMNIDLSLTETNLDH